MTTSAPENKLSVPPAARFPLTGRRKVVGWDVLVVILVGVALLLAGWKDMRVYFNSISRPHVTFRLANQNGEIRVGDDEFFHDGTTVVRLNHTSVMESADLGSFRHAEGPTETLEIWSERPRAQLDFLLSFAVDEQTVVVTFDGQTLEEIHARKGPLRRSYPVTLHPGSNEFTFSFDHYNGHGIVFENDDARPIAGTFETLNLFLP